MEGFYRQKQGLDSREEQKFASLSLHYPSGRGRVSGAGLLEREAQGRPFQGRSS